MKELSEVVAKILSILVKKPWLSGVVARDWREGNITPTFKNGRKDTWGTTEQ